jgi:thiosulfate reductase cytochrome b subunit
MIAARKEIAAPSAKRLEQLHPLVVRITHWINAAATILMIMSGWQIHNAYPTLPFRFPGDITLGRWLGGGLQWHFAAMWLVLANGLVYLTYALLSGRLRRKLLPIRFADLAADVRAALTGRLNHDDLAAYNAVQKLLYLGVIGAGVLAVLTGFAIWKPVQFRELTYLFGDFDTARLVHFLAMVAITLFLAVHVVMALLVPKSLRAMIRGR